MNVEDMLELNNLFGLISALLVIVKDARNVAIVQVLLVPRLVPLQAVVIQVLRVIVQALLLQVAARKRRNITRRNVVVLLHLLLAVPHLQVLRLRNHALILLVKEPPITTFNRVSLQKRVHLLQQW
jgi:hypothetical protein